MKLADWLRDHGVTRTAFASRIGVSPATITALTNGGWLSGPVAEAIVRETSGAVTANDFLPSRAPTKPSTAEAGANL